MSAPCDDPRCPCEADEPCSFDSSAASIEDDVVTLRKALDYPKLGYGYAYREALDALDRLAEAAHQSDRLRREIDSIRPHVEGIGYAG